MTPRPWQSAALAWGWALVWFFALDAAKVATYRIAENRRNTVPAAAPA